MTWKFDYGYARVKDLQIAGQRKSPSGRVEVSSVSLCGEPVAPTRRFWKSLFMRFGIADNVFRYFDHAEVFQRISERASDDSLRYCIARDAQGKGRLLAASSPRRPVIGFHEVERLVRRYGGNDLQYDDGIITSSHTPRDGERPFDIGGDQFKHRFVMETPIDGFGHPKIYLSFLRMICSNGAIGYSRAFRSDVSLGRDIGHCISRALESYDNGEGYAALRQRFESAQTSFASVHECNELAKLLIKAKLRQAEKQNALRRDFHRLTGGLNELYGLANLDALSNKRQRVLPAECRVYDLINFASEVATHHAMPTSSRTLQAYIGSLISDEYDMEGTAAPGQEFADFFMGAPDSGPRPSRN